jgi:hypothetical protein
MRQKSEYGYIGTLVGILVTLFTVALLFVFWFDQPITNVSENTESVQPQTASGTAPVTRREAYQADIDAAKAIQSTVTTENDAVVQELLQE